MLYTIFMLLSVAVLLGSIGYFFYQIGFMEGKNVGHREGNVAGMSQTKRHYSIKHDQWEERFKRHYGYNE